MTVKNFIVRRFPDGLMVRIPGFHCHGLGSVPFWGNRDPTSHTAKPEKKELHSMDYNTLLNLFPYKEINYELAAGFFN